MTPEKLNTFTMISGTNRTKTRTGYPARKLPWTLRQWRRLPKLVRMLFKIVSWLIPVPYEVGQASKYQKKTTGLPIPTIEVLILHAVMAIAAGYFL